MVMRKVNSYKPYCVAGLQSVKPSRGNNNTLRPNLDYSIMQPAKEQSTPELELILHSLIEGQ